jgi:ABC-type multidrug transport system permease subunit
MLRILLLKDLRRAWRNPIPLLINLALPLFITALISLAFGGKKEAAALGRIRVAIVDEDDSVLTGGLRAAVTRHAALEHLDPLFLNRSNAMRLIEDDKIAGVLIVPTNFQSNYISGDEPVHLELIKNPAQSIHPTVLEEAAGAVVTALDALARNFPWEGTEKFDRKRIGRTLEEFGQRFDKTNENYFAFVTYETEEMQDNAKQKAASNNAPATITVRSTNLVQERTSNSASAPAAASRKSRSTMQPDLSIFGYILVGLAAMFLLFIASHAMTDLQRELRFRTFARYQTIREALLPFVFGKVLFALVVLAICGAIMLGGGALAFGVRWTHPLELAVMTLGYACFATGLMALFVALMPGERRTSTLSDIAAMFLAMAGGCMFPVRQLPGFLRDHVSPLLPTYWYVETARELQAGNTAIPWMIAWGKLVVLGLILIALSTWLYRRRFRAGVLA